MNEKINEIAKMFGQDEVPPDVMNIISKIAQNSGDENDEESSHHNDPPSFDMVNDADSNPSGEELNDKKLSDHDLASDNLALMKLIKKVMDNKKNSQNDPAIILLNSLEPFLSNSRKSKLKKCMKVMNLTNMADLLKENNVF